MCPVFSDTRAGRVIVLTKNSEQESPVLQSRAGHRWDLVWMKGKVTRGGEIGHPTTSSTRAIDPKDSRVDNTITAEASSVSEWSWEERM